MNLENIFPGTPRSVIPECQKEQKKLISKDFETHFQAKTAWFNIVQTNILLTEEDLSMEIFFFASTSWWANHAKNASTKYRSRY